MLKGIVKEFEQFILEYGVDLKDASTLPSVVMNIFQDDEKSTPITKLSGHCARDIRQSY